MRISVEYDPTTGLTINCQLKPLVFRALIAAGAGAGLASIPWFVQLCKAMEWL